MRRTTHSRFWQPLFNQVSLEAERLVQSSKTAPLLVGISSLHNLSAFESYHFVYVDESDSDKRFGFGREALCSLENTPAAIVLCGSTSGSTPKFHFRATSLVRLLQREMRRYSHKAA